MRSFALASGSLGNCYYLESDLGVKILVDCGLSFKRTKEILNSKNIDINDINYLFITHEHIDHCLGLKTFVSNSDVKVFLSKGTKDALGDCLKNFEIIKELEVLELEDIKIIAFKKSHDSNEAFSYLFENGRKVGIFTDMGFICEKVMHVLKDVDVLYFESSYCYDVIKKSNLRYIYVNRLISDVGHLSLDDACEILSQVTNDNQKIVLSHISQNANTYENAYLKVKSSLEEKGKRPQIFISFQDEPTDWIE